MLPKVHAQTVEHHDGAFYVHATNTTPPGIYNQPGVRMEILQRHERPLSWRDYKFLPNEWSLVLKGLSRAKAEAIVLILNAPEDDD